MRAKRSVRSIVRLWPAAIALGLLAAPLGRAQDSLETQKRAELQEIRRKAAENREAARRLAGQEKSAVSKLRRTERDLSVTRKRLRSYRERHKVLGRQLDVARAQFQHSSFTLQQQRERLSRRLRNLYKYGGAEEIEFLLSPRSFAQLLARWDYMVMVAERDRMLLEDVLAQKDLVQADQSRLEKNIDQLQLNTRRETAADKRLAGLRSERAQTVKTIQSQREAYEQAAAELEKTARATQRLIASLEAKRREEASRARAEGRAPQPYTGNFAQGQGQLDWPVRGRLVGHFGNEKHPKWGTVTVNNGIDIAADIGTPVRVVARGRVDYVSEDFGTYGQMVIVNHGDGYYTLYGHLSSISVSVGQEVGAGQVIAASGDTGSLKGSVLHFEVRKGGTSLNPEDWLQ